jgi:hypothetical protein
MDGEILFLNRLEKWAKDNEYRRSLRLIKSWRRRAKALGNLVEDRSVASVEGLAHTAEEAHVSDAFALNFADEMLGACLRSLGSLPAYEQENFYLFVEEYHAFLNMIDTVSREMGVSDSSSRAYALPPEMPEVVARIKAEKAKRAQHRR